VFGASGLAALYALRLAVVTCSFWVLRVDELYELFEGVFETARFPVTYFREPVRGLLTYVVPLAFATTFPTEALLGRADYRLLPAGLALAAGALLAAHLLWGRAVRHYSSAGG
jgi:ABC-2 type transport system permease protein